MRRALELQLVVVRARRVFQAGVLLDSTLLGVPGQALGSEQDECLGAYQIPGVLSSAAGRTGVRMEPQLSVLWYLGALYVSLLHVRTWFRRNPRVRVRAGSFLGHGCVHIHQKLPKIFP